MPTDLNPVRPGDLITSDFMNRLLDHIDTLEERIANLEDDIDSELQVRITQFEPQGEQEVGRTLSILGQNFLFPPSQNQVTINGIPATDFGLSSPTRIRVTVPQITGVPTDVVIRVENSNGADEASYRIVPATSVGDNPPEITAVENPATGGNRLRVGEPIVIRGSNFASNPAENTLLIASRVRGRENEVYEITQIAEGESSETQIRATLPSNIEIQNSFTFDPMEIRLTVADYEMVVFPVEVED
jgi:hypothetical protein